MFSAPLQCKPGFVPCTNVTQCIWGEYWCDHQGECKDQSDEQNGCVPPPTKPPTDCEYFVTKWDVFNPAKAKQWPDGTLIEWPESGKLVFTFGFNTAVTGIIVSLKKDAMVEINFYDAQGKARGPPTVIH